MTKEKLRDAFFEVFGGTEEPVLVFSPGRVNLIGEHIDYNGGRVFPCALTMGTWFAGRKREDKRLRIYSENFRDLGIVERSSEELSCDPDKGFTNYPAGLIWTFRKNGLKIPCGMDVYLSGNIPYASGLSSSASVEVGMGLLLSELFGLEVLPEDIALFSQYSENNFNGLNCGIMDQFVIAMGKKDCAVYLDTASLAYEYAPVKLEGVKLVIGCTNKKRGLTDSKYNERRAECEEALSLLQKAADIQSLCELSLTDYEDLAFLLEKDNLKKRVRHVVSENERVRKAVEALRQGDLELFGKLMNESHVSLRDDYEVTGIELDTLTEEAWNVEGCLGARMTGAGFGGCNVALVKDEAVEDFIRAVGGAYKEKIGYEAGFYVAEIGDGVHVM